MFKDKLEIKLKSYDKDSFTITIDNNDTSFTEKIIEQNIIISNLYYKITLRLLDKLDSIIKSKYLPKYVKSNDEKFIYINYSFNEVEYKFMETKKENVYKVSVDLVEKYNLKINDSDEKNKIENHHKSSNLLIFNNAHGIISEEKILDLNKLRYKKKIICDSEKDAIKGVQLEIQYNELEGILPLEDIKSLTIENRLFTGMDKFINSNNKFSRIMTSDRKKKVLFGTKSKVLFDEKMIKNSIYGDKNPFMKNEWFMGPIYSYDKNYKKYI
jgi:hypothetical protein